MFLTVGKWENPPYGFKRLTFALLGVTTPFK